MTLDRDWKCVLTDGTETVSYENGQLVTDDALSQAMLNVLTDTEE